jgi:ribonuclease Y
VEKVYAIQAGREVRVMVDSGSTDDKMALLMSKDIARRVELELAYPGQIKVCIIRETRASAVAK